MRDLKNIPAVDTVGNGKFIEAKEKIKGTVETIKKAYVSKEVDKKVTQGMSVVAAEAIVKSRLEDKVLLPEDSVILNDGTEILIKDIIANPEKYDGQYIFDPLEPEKGSGKAIINASDKGITAWSYLHGGCMYKLETKMNKKQVSQESTAITINQFSDLIVQRLKTTNEYDLEDIVNQIINSGVPITSYYTNLYIYAEDYWRKHENEDIEKKVFIKACIKKITGKRATKNQIEAVHKELLMEYIDLPDTQEILINFNDGILKINNGNYEKILHNPEYRKLYKLAFPYEPTALCPLTDKFCLDVMGDQDTVDLFFEFLGACFINNDYFKLEKACFLFGSGSNGKSVILDLIRELFGKINISTVALKDMSVPERRHSMVGKLLNIASEGSSKKFDSEDFKAIITREPLPVRVMYDNATDTADFPRLIFATNNMPYTGGDVSHGLLRRVLIIHFEKVIAEEDQDKQLLEKLKPELSGMMNRVLEGMMRLLKNGNLTKSAKVERTLEQYEMQINPVKYFINEKSLVSTAGTQIYDSKKLYKLFQTFCGESGIHTVNIRNFNSMMKNAFGEMVHSNNLYGWRITEKKSEPINDSEESYM